MVISCCAYECTNRWGKLKEDGTKLQFHLFPFRKPDLLKKWIVAVKRESWKPSKSSALCGDHFTETAYRTSAQRYLKDDAVPSVFTLPSHLLKSKQERAIPIRHPLPVAKKRKVTNELEIATAAIDELATLALAQDINPSDPPCQSTEDPSALTHQPKTSAAAYSPIKAKLRRKIKLLQQKLRRRNKKIVDLNSMLAMAQKMCDMSSDTSDLLKDTFGEVPFDILVHQMQNKKRKPKGRRYTASMKEFALTLYFYSPRSYNFLRKNMCLPHPAMLRTWVSTANCFPGFLDEAHAYIKSIAEQQESALDCALIIDSMSIRKQILWDKSQNKYAGYVECAGIVEGPEPSVASEALVFLLVSISMKFKVPIAYFFVDKINSAVLSQLINVCLSKLHDLNVNILSITADGIASNVRCFQLLGCNITGCTSSDDFVTYFSHPVSCLPVYVIFDPCHMLKLARNLLAEKQLITSRKGSISWFYITALEKLQNDIEFKFANKLSGAHINYKNKIMNVSLAAQTLSSGTADALQFLMNLKQTSFLGAEATIEFIRIIDRIFDILNSRNPFGKGYKSPLTLANQTWWEGIFVETIDYLLSLKLNKVDVLKTRRKMFALGFIVSIKSISALTEALLKKAEHPLKYVLTYKVSQDHIELFFNSIRACGGFNNNPNVCQFRWSLRKLLLAGNISTKNSNCMNNNVVVPSILEFRSPKRTLTEPHLNDEDYLILSVYCDCLDNVQLSYYQNNVLYYIGGYIVKSILKQLTCQSCVNMLLYSKGDHTYNSLKLKDPKSFTFFVSRGGLKNCSMTVFKIISISEQAFRLLMLKEKPGNCDNINFKLKVIINEYMMNQNIKFHHPIENEIGFEDLHESQMTKQVIDRYLRLRLKLYGRNLTLKDLHQNSATKRQKLTKLILFQNV